jgi:putative transposase
LAGALGIRSDGQKVLLAVRDMGGESEAAWRGVLDDLLARGLRMPQFLAIDGAAGLERALAALWPAVPTQRCTVHKHRNLLAHAPEKLHDEITADYTDMIYADNAHGIEKRHRAFLRKWRLKCRAVADSLEEAGDRLFTFTRLPSSQWKSARTTNAIERLHQESRQDLPQPPFPQLEPDQPTAARAVLSRATLHVDDRPGAGTPPRCKADPRRSPAACCSDKTQSDVSR